MFPEYFLPKIAWLGSLLHRPDWPPGPRPAPAPPPSPHLPHGLLVLLQLGRQAGTQVEDGEQEVELLLLRQKAGHGLASSELVGGESQEPEVRLL